MGEQHDKTDPIITRVGKVLGFAGADEAVAKVSGALGRAGVTRGDVLVFIPIFLAFYADT
jgi:hypothetical protein